MNTHVSRDYCTLVDNIGIEIHAVIASGLQQVCIQFTPLLGQNVAKCKQHDTCQMSLTCQNTPCIPVVHCHWLITF